MKTQASCTCPNIGTDENDTISIVKPRLNQNCPTQYLAKNLSLLRDNVNQEKKGKESKKGGGTRRNLVNFLLIPTHYNRRIANKAK